MVDLLHETTQEPSQLAHTKKHHRGKKSMLALPLAEFAGYPF
jgi:hypothetical protein